MDNEPGLVEVLSPNLLAGTEGVRNVEGLSAEGLGMRPEEWEMKTNSEE